MISFYSQNVNDTLLLGNLIAKHSFKGALVLLDGDLGAGKTTLTSGMAQCLGIKEKIMSPTFNILKCYFVKPMSLYHIDAYRLEENTNRDIGLEEFIEGDGLCVIEWPNYIKEWIPSKYLKVAIEHVDGGNKRKITISCFDERFTSLIKEIKEVFSCTEYC